MIISTLLASCMMPGMGVTVEQMQNAIKPMITKGVIIDNITLHKNSNSEDIKHVLNSWVFTHEYKLNEFDCSDMSQLTWDILTEAGYNTKIVYKVSNDCKSAHVFVLVTKKDEEYIIECTNNTNSAIGRIIEKDEENQYPYFQGWALIFNDTNEFNQIPEFGGGGLVNNQNIRTRRGGMVRGRSSKWTR